MLPSKIVYVLVVLGHAYSGHIVTFQEFNSFQECEKAKNFVMYTDNLWGDDKVSAICIEK